MLFRFIRPLPLLCFPGIAIIGTEVEAAQSSAKAASMTEIVAMGSFDVKLTPASPPDAPIGGMAISKTFHGDLEGSSTGQMLAVRTPVEGSAGYVAMERVTGRWVSRFSIAAKGSQSLSVPVVPDSGTEGLAGLMGSMDIKIEGGNHLYTLRYSVP
jgi:hypothetical protein